MSELTYAYLPPEGDITRHMWTLVGPKGAVHAWAEPASGTIRELLGEAYYGGIEIHSPKRIYGDGEPNHKDCWLLKGPCWHDGSSLQFSECIEPFISNAELPFRDGVHEYIYSILHRYYQSHFVEDDAA